MIFVIAAVVALGIVLAVILGRARRARPQRLSAPVSWAHSAGDEFDGLSDAERCDLVFALAAVDDEPSRSLLERALDDPSEAVCLAAARALAQLGCTGAIERHFRAHPGERTRRVSEALELLT